MPFFTYWNHSFLKWPGGRIVGRDGGTSFPYRLMVFALVAALVLPLSPRSAAGSTETPQVIGLKGVSKVRRPWKYLPRPVANWIETHRIVGVVKKANQACDTPHDPKTMGALAKRLYRYRAWATKPEVQALEGKLRGLQGYVSKQLLKRHPEWEHMNPDSLTVRAFVHSLDAEYAASAKRRPPAAKNEGAPVSKSGPNGVQRTPRGQRSGDSSPNTNVIRLQFPTSLP